MAPLSDHDPAQTAFVFPGQGSQFVGMGRDLAEAFPAARLLFDEADEVLGFSISRIMWEGPAEQLNETVNTQPALFIHSLAAYEIIKGAANGFRPAFLAGHSLGELSALAAGGALPFAAALRLVRRRGELMKSAGELNPGGMAAILNLDIPALEKVCSEASTPEEPVQVANDNSPGQVVISGSKPAVERAMELAKAAGARRAIPLAVSIAAHSKLMAPIQQDWEAAVSEAGLKDSRIPIIGNIEATVISSAAELAMDIQSQMQSRVRWTESLQMAKRQGIRTYLEVGSGTVLLGLIKRVDAEATCIACGSAAEINALM